MGTDKRILEGLFGDRLAWGVPMRDFTTLRIGGPAQAMAVARTQEELIEIVRIARGEGIPFLLLGGGSNLLVADEGVASLAIKNEVGGVWRRGDLVVARAGARLQDLVDFTLGSALAGLERMTGIPGTVGGAVYGNAGAYGQTISDHLEEVICFDGSNLRSLGREDCQFAYRSSVFKRNGFIVLEVCLRLAPADPSALIAESREIRRQRLLKYPVGLRCPGSFFMNVLAEQLPAETLALIPPDKVIYGKVPAGYLLEQAGAKGQVRGDIEISQVNANLFINRGDGTAADFILLATEQARNVKQKYGIELTPEVQFIDLPPLQLS